MYEFMSFEDSLERKKIRGRVLNTLEFNKIREAVTAKARTQYGRELCADMAPCCDVDYVTSELSCARQAMDHILRFGMLPLGGMRDLREPLVYARADGTLTCGQLLEVASFLRASGEIRKALTKARSAGSPVVDETEPDICSYIDKLEICDKLLEKIESSILGQDEVSDKASKELSSIRRERKNIASGIRSLLDRVISNHADMLQESIVTLREGRYCIPVKADFNGRIEGIVHGASSSGQTLFIEPMSVVDANNKIAELTFAEQAEIQRILKSFTNEVVSIGALLENNMAIASRLDYIFAKGEYGVENNSFCPVLNTEGRIALKGARHPLIPKDSVVPVDINVGEGYDALIVTGPNTGGKTVSLKTCGLLVLMTMAGLPVPAESGSEVCVFDRVLADIGDEQSIEESLSTFSSHMSNIVFILKNIRGKSLVLLDELGSGTDPAEGAALAISIIEELRKKNCIVMSTTHYRELKGYAETTEGVMNASCEFDTETLAPTYKLITGRPGSSNAFVISRKLGLAKHILDNARTRMSSDELRYEELLAKAEEESKRAQTLAEENDRLNVELRAEKARLEEENAKLKQSKTKILNDMRSEQKRLLQEQEKELSDELRELRKRSKDMDRAEREKELDKIRRKLRAGINDLEEEDDEAVGSVALSGEPVKQVIKGECYYVPSLDQTGIAESDLSKSGTVNIICGNMKIAVKKSQLMMPTKAQRDEFLRTKNGKAASKAKGRQVTGSAEDLSKVRFNSASTTTSEIMLIGMTTAEAESRLARYLEDCVLAGIKEARIVHGKGTGALRACVQDMLIKDDRVDSFRAGEQGEGDAGVTIVKFR
ncbi:MAG: endonuclease MutS2 [Clostridiales bacterium]|nr:endonuclease MutS2 [Clostridiales bacterium]